MMLDSLEIGFRLETEEDVRPRIMPYNFFAGFSMILATLLIWCTVVWYGGKEEIRTDALMKTILLLGIGDGILQLAVTKILCLMDLRDTLKGLIWLTLISFISSFIIFSILTYKFVQQYPNLLDRLEYSELFLIIVSGLIMLLKASFLIFHGICCLMRLKCKRVGSYDTMEQTD